MAVFEYKGLDASGKAANGIIDAESAKVARSKLRKQGIFPTEIAEQRSGAGGLQGSGLNVKVDLSKYTERITVSDVSTLTSQMSTLVGAGIPMVEALSALVDQVENGKLRVVMAEVRDKVNEGAALADGMAGHPEVFSDLYVSMVRAGEASGALDVVLKRLAEYTESQVRLRNKIQSAMMYPVLMALLGSAIVIGLFTFVIPKIRRIFDSFGATLPLLTRIVLGISDFFTSWWWLVLILSIGFAFFFRRWVKTPEGSKRFDGWTLKIPVFGKLNRQVAVSRFCRTLSTLLDSGVPILSALSIVMAVVDNKVLAEAIQKSTKNVAEGQSLAAPLKQSGQFPAIVTHMIAIGEKTGELEDMLGKIADAYDAEVEATVTGLTSLLEPILIAVMGGVVAIMALAILQPMLNLSQLAK